MTKKKWKKQFLAGMLCMGMVFQSCPMHAFAKEALVSQLPQEETEETSLQAEEQMEPQLLQGESAGGGADGIPDRTGLRGAASG